MENLIRYFVSRHLLVNVVVIATVVFGYLSATQLQREFVPSFDTPIIWITARLPGASARDIETKITIPLEDAIDEVAGIENFHTTISDNTSFTTVELIEDYDAEQIAEAKLDLQEALDSVTDFPPEMEDEPVLKHLNPAQAPVIEVNLSGPEQEVYDTAKRLEKKIEQLDLIASVDAVGMNDPEVRVLLDPAKILEHGITLQQVIGAIEKRNVSSTGGVLKTAADSRQVVMWSRFDDPMEVGDIILRFNETGMPLRISDIARIENGFEDNRLRVHTNATRGITLLANKREKADIIHAARAVERLVNETEHSDEVVVALTNDESFRVANRLKLIATNGIIGGILVAITLFVFLRAQAAFWIVIAIPVVFLAALAILGRFDLTLNFATLGGFILVLGMVVDDAVVVSERIVYKQSLGMAGPQAAVAGTLEMVRSVVAASLTTMLAFSPVLALGGLPGKIAWQMPFVVILALLVSLAESFFILPAHMSAVPPAEKPKKQAWLVRLESRYRSLLESALLHRGRVVAIALLAFFIIMGFLAPKVPFVLFPQDDADRLFLKVNTAIGTPIEHTEAVVTELEKQLIDITGSDLDAVMSRIGHQETQMMSKNVGDADNEALIIIQFHKLNRINSNVEWMPIIRSRLAVPEGVELVFLSKYDGPPTDQPVTIHILSNDDSERRNTAFEIARELTAIEGVTNIDVNERPGMPQIDLNLDYEKLAQRGLDAATVGKTLSAAFYGIPATEHRDLDRTTDIRVMLEPYARGDLNALMEIPLASQNGALVKLRDVVRPIENASVTRIYHRDGYRSATIRANFAPDSDWTSLSFANHLNEHMFPRYNSIPGLEVYNGGESVDTERTAGNMGIAGLIAISSIGVVIWLMLGSLLEAAFILVAIPFAVAGVMLVFFLHDKSLSMFAVIGTIGLCGVVVNASIVMMDSIHRAVNQYRNDNSEEEQSQEKQRAVVLDAIVERLRPIMITTLTTLLGVFPSAYGIGGYDTFVSSISLAIGWGLLFSTLVTLFLVPVLYSLASDFNSKVLPAGLAALRQRSRPGSS